MADDFVDPFDTGHVAVSPAAPKPVASSAAPAGGFVDPFALGSEGASSQEGEPLTRWGHAKEVVTGLLPKTWEGIKEAGSTLNKQFNPFSAENAQAQDEYLKEVSAAPWYDVRPQLKHFGEGPAAIGHAVGSLFKGPATSIGHAVETVMPQFTPEQKEALRQKGITYPTPEETGNLLLSAAMPGRPKVPVVAPALPKPSGPLGVTLSKGQETGELPLIQREQAALQGASGKPAQTRALEFQAQQEAETAAAKDQVLDAMTPPFQKTPAVTTPHEAAELIADNLTGSRQAVEAAQQGRAAQLAQEHEGFRSALTPNQQVLAQSPTEAADIISRSVDAANESARGASAAAYKSFGELPGQFHPASFNKIADQIKRDIAYPEDPAQMTLINPQNTPITHSALDDLQDILGGISQRRDPDTGRVIPRPPVTPKLVENARQRLNSYLGDAIAAARQQPSP